MRKCRFCGSDNCHDLFDFADLPLGHPVETNDSSVWSEILGYFICDDCDLIQTKHEIPHELLINENVILSKISAKVSEHYKSYPDRYEKLLSLDKNRLIVEIGCSDSELLKEFQYRGCTNLLGIDPALHPNVDYNFEIVEDFFTPELVPGLKRNKPSPQLIIANYVIALIPDLQTFFDALIAYMDEGCAFIMEVPYFCDFISKFRVDGLAHLRCNWFTMHSVVQVYDRNHLEIIELEHDTTYRGGTLRVTAVKRDGEVQNSVKYARMLEEEKPFFSDQHFKEFQEKLESKKQSIKKQVREIASSGFQVLGYGGGIKSSTIVNWLQLSDRDIAMTVDIDPNKHNRYIPLTSIPILSLPELFEQRQGTNNIAVILLAIDHIPDAAAFLKSKMIPGDQIVQVLPEFHIETIPEA